MYNEIANIERAVADARAMATAIVADWEVVLVDDASTDGSGALVDRLSEADPHLRVIHHPHNRKLGGALRTGFAAATKEWVLYTDSDLPIRVADAVRAFPLSREADLVIGYRVSRHEGWKREVMSWGYNLLIRALFRLKVRDVNFAFKLFRRSILDRVQLRSEGSFIDAEFLVEAARAGFTLREVGMPYYARQAGVSTLARPGVVFRILVEMGQYWSHELRSLHAFPHRQRG
jgi:glycosyltransferase involved in cell wall biosynthesis